jgi:hypothetical protein
MAEVNDVNGKQSATPSTSASPWNPVESLKRQYPKMRMTDEQIYSNLQDPEKFRSAFPQYSGLKDDEIRSKVQQYGKPASRTGPNAPGSFTEQFHEPGKRVPGGIETQKFTRRSDAANAVLKGSKYLPAAGATVGAIAGHGWGSIPGAALGGAAGEAGRQLVERGLGGDDLPVASPSVASYTGAGNAESIAAAKDIGIEGAKWGVSQAAFGLAFKGAGALWEAGRPMAKDAAARALTKAINPVLKEWPNYIRSIKDQSGNIKLWADRSGKALNSVLDWAEAAKGAGNQSAQLFLKRYVEPVAKEEISVAGAGYRGRVTDAHRATVGDIYERILKINDELRPSYVKTEQGMVQTALANEGELLAEKASLTTRMEEAISKKTGAKPEEIAELRKRTAQMLGIADHTEAAANYRASSAGRADEGNLPTGKSGVVSHTFNKIFRGGPEGIADRGFRTALKRSPRYETALPEPGIAVGTRGADAAREAGRAGRAQARELIPSHQSTITATGPEVAAERQANLQARIARNQASSASRTANGAEREAARAERISTREAIPSQQSSATVTGEELATKQRAELQARIARNNAAKVAAKAKSAKDAERAAARKMIAQESDTK